MRRLRLNGLILRPLIGGVLCFVTIAMVLLRMFAVTFFWASVSRWAVVPALVIVAMLFIADLAQSLRRYIASALVGCYLCSIYFDGWSTITARIAEGGSAWFEATEAALIGIFMLLNLMSNSNLTEESG